MKQWLLLALQKAYLPYLLIFFFVVMLQWAANGAAAATIHQYRDTLSNSAPNEYANHTVEFLTTVPIPPGGYVRFVPDDGDFTVPALNFDHKNVEIAVSTSSGFITRAATTSPGSFEDGIIIVPGISGFIEVTLNNDVGIPAGAFVRLKIGSHTELSTTTDLGLLNPPTIGTFEYRIETGGGGEDEQVRGLVAMVNQVSVPNVDTREFIPPFRFNGAPTGTISGTTQNVEVSLETDEFAKCRWSTATDTPYFSMGNEFTTSFKTIHPIILAVATNTTYTLFVRCIDDEGNVNTDDYIINFTVPEYPEGNPGDDGDDEDEGGGTGDGSGDDDDGSGDPTGNDNSSGGSSGGGGGGGGGGGSGSGSEGNDGGGGFENGGAPYQSGDGRVIINGYAFPQSDVYILVDGAVAKRVTANSSGSFTVNIEDIARGVYTFGIYAVDSNGIRSSTFSTTFTVTGSRGSTLSNINVMPSIKVTPDPVDPGATLTVSGYAIPNALITLENQPDKSSVGLKTFTTNSGSNGLWTINIDTTGLKTGTYKVRAKAKQEGGLLIGTNFSDYTFYGVGETAQVPRGSDLNRDGRVNLIDFSILLFWWNTDGGASSPSADINADGRVSLTDFSIMIFNWTG